ncbi:MAG: hypothetical protein ABFC31_12000 [Clostridiaceae bacterium]
MDNYVDGVDRPVNMHQNAGNIYARVIAQKRRGEAWLLHDKRFPDANSRQKTSRQHEAGTFLTFADGL